MDTAQAGDRCDFVGTLIVVPDVGSMSMPGEFVSCTDCLSKDDVSVNDMLLLGSLS